MNNHPFITIASGLVGQLFVFFLFDNPQFEINSTMDHVGQLIVKQYVMSKQYKTYLTQLRHPSLPQSVLTAKLLFYIKTCSFYFYSYLHTKVLSFPCTADEIMQHLCEDYLQIIQTHSRTISSWSKELLGCIGQLGWFGLCMLLVGMHNNGHRWKSFSQQNK